MTALRVIDIVLVAMTAPVLALVGAPALGVLAGAGVWIVQRFIELGLARYAASRPEVRTTLGLNLAGVFGRAWLCGLTILAVGLGGERKDGLAAAVLVFVAFTIYLITSLMTRSLERNSIPS